eukprot:1181812-Prorocentrum_minimum.AAC.1
MPPGVLEETDAEFPMLTPRCSRARARTRCLNAVGILGVNVSSRTLRAILGCGLQYLVLHQSCASRIAIDLLSGSELSNLSDSHLVAKTRLSRKATSCATHRLLTVRVAHPLLLTNRRRRLIHMFYSRGVSCKAISCATHPSRPSSNIDQQKENTDAIIFLSGFNAAT